MTLPHEPTTAQAPHGTVLLPAHPPLIVQGGDYLEMGV